MWLLLTGVCFDTQCEVSVFQSEMPALYMKKQDYRWCDPHLLLNFLSFYSIIFIFSPLIKSKADPAGIHSQAPVFSY